MKCHNCHNIASKLDTEVLYVIKKGKILSRITITNIPFFLQGAKFVANNSSLILFTSLTEKLHNSELKRLWHYI